MNKDIDMVGMMLRKMPKFLVNPTLYHGYLTLIPSQLGNFDGSWYRFHWFEFTTSIMDLMADVKLTIEK